MKKVVKKVPLWVGHSIVVKNKLINVLKCYINLCDTVVMLWTKNNFHLCVAICTSKKIDYILTDVIFIVSAIVCYEIKL